VKIRIAFCKEETTIYHKVVKWWTRSAYSHAELVLPNNESLSISPMDLDGVRLTYANDFTDAGMWDLIEIEITTEQHRRLLKFYEATKSDQYDWIGMLLSQFTPFHIKRLGRWYCSEWIAYALRIIGVVDDVYAYTDLSPQRLHELLTKKGYSDANKQR
jgi:hypothetical protein|tara:strand:+ start:7363 stop:7839 length:477 start_codon:yes stop_codon:yes gene_type:complete